MPVGTDRVEFALVDSSIPVNGGQTITQILDHGKSIQNASLD
jgi:hypothetical protein